MEAIVVFTRYSRRRTHTHIPTLDVVVVVVIVQRLPRSLPLLSSYRHSLAASDQSSDSLPEAGYSNATNLCLSLFRFHIICLQSERSEREHSSMHDRDSLILVHREKERGHGPRNADDESCASKKDERHNWCRSRSPCTELRERSLFYVCVCVSWNRG